LDDALHYLKSQGIVGNHRTVERPTLKGSKEFSLTNGTSNGITTARINGMLPGEKANGTATLNGTKDTADALVNGNGASHHDVTLKERLFVFSAFDEAATGRLLDVYHEHLSANNTKVAEEGAYLDDLSYTLAVKRTTFPWRVAINARSAEELLEKLALTHKPIRANPNPRVAFVFTGQGAQVRFSRQILYHWWLCISPNATNRFLIFSGMLWAASC
jgi:hypothetical protein